MGLPSLFDAALFNNLLFYPRRDRSPAPRGARDAFVEVEPGVQLHLRRHQRPDARAVCLLFHGNGEVVADYDDAVDRFAEVDLALAVVDYRGYGQSSGTPTLRSMIQDVRPCFDAFAAEAGDRPIVVMGRSLGGICAAFLSAERLPGVVGFIFESAASDLLGVVRRRGVPEVLLSAQDRATFDPILRAQRCQLPALVLHGAQDELIHPDEARSLYAALGSARKELVWVDGRGHNDLSLSPAYWAAIHNFVEGLG